jgi:hypothetical protein
METTTKRRVTYHVRNRDGVHDFISREKAISFGRALNAQGWIGDRTIVWEQERHDDGQPAADPNVIWSKVRS